MSFPTDDSDNWNTPSIPDFEVNHNNVTFKYNGAELVYRGHGYDPRVERFLP